MIPPAGSVPFPPPGLKHRLLRCVHNKLKDIQLSSAEHVIKNHAEILVMHMATLFNKLNGNDLSLHALQSEHPEILQALRECYKAFGAAPSTMTNSRTLKAKALVAQFNLQPGNFYTV